jgi:PPOX class probable F420-dependent enzyme
MPLAPVPDDVSEFLSQPHMAVVASLTLQGAPHSATTWYDWEDGRVLLSMDNTRVRLKYLRNDPRVSLTVIDGASWYRHISLMGEVVEFHDDEGLADIDRLARRYTGEDYATRDSPRTTAWVRVDRWHGWDSSRARVTDASWPTT